MVPGEASHSSVNQLIYIAFLNVKNKSANVSANEVLWLSVTTDGHPRTLTLRASASIFNAMLNGPTRPQFDQIVAALTPVLDQLPGKIVAIDGWPGVGKTTLGRFLAWRFNSTLLETDLFLIERQGRLIHRDAEIQQIIDRRISIPRPIFVDGVNVLALLRRIDRAPDFTIHLRNKLVTDAGNLADEVARYEADFRPLERADLRIELET